MREIKFRVWDNNFKRMLLANDIKFVDGRMIGAKGVNWDSKVAVMQYTGLKDKNGVFIYEGDIVQAEEQIGGGYGCYDGEIIFSDTDFAFMLKTDNHKLFLSNDGEPSYEVIGNIYQNPELLGRV